MNIEALAQEICRVGRSLFERGYVHASAGNISVRTDSGYLITPTDACLGTLDAARLAEVNAQGEQVGGDRASKTLALHRAIYAADPEARCVLHTHATHAVALTRSDNATMRHRSASARVMSCAASSRLSAMEFMRERVAAQQRDRSADSRCRATGWRYAVACI